MRGTDGGKELVRAHVNQASGSGQFRSVLIGLFVRYALACGVGRPGLRKGYVTGSEPELFDGPRPSA
ncbi:MAG: hypothetical protein A4E20_01015 [Nitrospira sp. SG-bin2]|jgi:hypothetical protein|uniref:hypothetical protein n=1 Tax=Nitrospira cf. moscoviensis SBR1015 TaxID=96242 RepID=UPI000A09EC97|nr:hypothetical protein [Nitrospira cf. moscoviensis SBR1015]OQW35601.1 MAG: hypothetical protein A4E20_01015 [Nitrospira sp. SG-bin2]